MSESPVKQASKAFREEKFLDAIQHYREAGDIYGHYLFKQNINLCRKRFLEQCSAQSNFKSHGDEFADISRSIKYADRLRVALIADEFTANSFSDEFIAIHILPDNWQEQFEIYQPEIFFCESAWSGPDSVRRPWKGRIYASKNWPKENRASLLEILAHCRKHGIPSIFWNKEDPSHFNDRVHDFVKTAKEFDHIFTTAEECIGGYKQEHGVSQVYSLPFASNPRLFNPFQTKARSSKIVFAGSWYKNHSQRCLDTKSILDCVHSQGYEVEIYDRYFNSSDPLHIWPEEYKQFLHPSQPHEQMPNVYKSSRFGLNINTVTASSTMFARRAFELMSCNTLVISNYSLGMDKMFGDLVIYPDKNPNRLPSLSSAEIDKMRDTALHKVLSEHTYRQRWLHILQKAGISHAARQYSVTATYLTNSKKDVLPAISWFQQHCGHIPNTQLLIIAGEEIADLEVADIYQEFNQRGVCVTSVSHAKRYALLDKFLPVQTTHFMPFNLEHMLPSGWIEKVMLHLQYWTKSPIALAHGACDLYKLNMINSESLFIDAAHRFSLWLDKPKHRIEAYCV